VSFDAAHPSSPEAVTEISRNDIHSFVAQQWIAHTLPMCLLDVDVRDQEFLLEL
jgi:hypothetical protein